MVVCIFNARSALLFRVKARDIIYDYCSHVVVCYLRSKSLTDTLIWETSGAIMTRTPPTKVMVGLSGADADSWLQTAIMRGYRIASLVQHVKSAMAKNDVRGGLHLHVPDLDIKTPPWAFSSLIRLLQKSLRSRDQILLVTLPGDVKLHSTLLTNCAMRSGAFFVTMTHFVPPPDQSGTVVCSTPSKPAAVLDGRTNSLKNWNDHLGRVRNDHTPFSYLTNAVQKILFTFDLACFEYQVEHHGKPTFHRRRQCP